VGICVWCGGLQCDGVCVVWICVWCVYVLTLIEFQISI